MSDNSSGSIYVNFQMALRQADALEQQARSLRQTAVSRLENVSSQVRGGWQGENCELWQHKCAELGGKIQKTAEELEGAAASLRSSARRIYQAEMEAQRLARERSIK